MVKLSATFNGAMDRDSDDRYIKQGDYRTLKNGIIDRDADGGRYLVKNLRSSKLVAELPTSAKLVGAKEYKGFFYQFYYDSITHELSLYRVNPYAENDYVRIFERELKDTFTEEIPGDPGSTTPAGTNFYNNFLLADVGGASHLYIYNALQVNGDITVDSSATAGSAFDSEADFNSYFRIANEGTQDEYVICNVPIVSKVEAEGPNENTITTTDFSSFADFQQYVTVKNKGLADEYIVITLPLLTEEVLTAFTSEAFASASDFTFEDVVEDPTDPTTVIVGEDIYEAISDINYIDFIENQSNGDIMCYWTDGVNPPFKVNISWLSKEGNNYHYIRDMFVAKVVPPEPSIIPYHDYSYTGVDTRHDVFQFATRYVYQDGEKTPLSTYSKAAFYPSIGEQITSNSQNIGYYVDNGTLYQISGFDNSSPITISSGLDANYNHLLVSDDGNVMVVFSSTNSLPVMTSVNKGATFTEATGDAATRKFLNGDISEDGQYIYLLEDGGSVKRSIDYGSSFVNTDRLHGSVEGKISCSRDGKYVAAYVFDTEGVDSVSSSRYYQYQVRILADSGEGSILTSFNASVSCDSGSIITDRSSYLKGTISKNGKYFAFSNTHIDTPENNYIRVFNILTDSIIVSKQVSSIVNTIFVEENGTGFADNYRTSDFFNQVSLFDEVDNLWPLSNGFIGEFGGTYTRYNEFGVAENSGILSINPYYVPGVSVREAIKNVFNFYNAVDIWVDKPNPYVETVEVFAINTNDGTTYLAKEIDYDDFDVESNGMYVTFRNNLIYRVLSETEKNILFSNVPLKASHQAFIGNRLFYANYHDGRNLPKLDIDVIVQSSEIETSSIESAIQPDDTQILFSSDDSLSIVVGDALTLSFSYTDNGEIYTRQFKHVFTSGYNSFGGLDWEDISIELESTFKTLFPSGSVTATHDDVNGEFSILFATGDSSVTFNNIYRSVLEDGQLTYRKGVPQQLGIVYYDEYNRGSYPIFGDFDAIIPSNINSPKQSIVASISHAAPDWAKNYKFVRTDRNLQYTIVPGFRYAKAQNGYIYLMKQEGESFLPDVGMFLDVHDNNGDLHSLQVVSRENKDADFVVGSPVGEWISVKDPQIDGLSSSDVIGGSSLYSTSTFYARQSLETSDSLVYYEIPGVYEVRDGMHYGNIMNQSTDIPAQVRLVEDGNVFYLPDVGVEIYQTSGGGQFWNGGRALLDVENVGEIHRYSSITWSDQFVQDTGYNGLSMFNQGIINWKNLDIAKGHINGVLPIDTNLYVWQEDHVGYVLINKNAITTALGEDAITSANQVAGQFVPYGGEYGTMHPRSITHYGNIRYFVDTKRDSVCRISQDGISEISLSNMATEFHRILDVNDEYISAFNIDHKELWVYSNAEQAIYVYDEKVRGWTRMITGIDINALLADDKNVFTINNSVVYSQMAGDDYGVVNGEAKTFEFEYVQNAEPQMVKVWNTSEIEANKPIETVVSIGGSYNAGETFNSSTISADNYEMREGEYFAYVPCASNLDISSFEPSLDDGGVIVPLGIVKDTGVGAIELTSDITEPIGEINHELFVAGDGEPPTHRGSVQAISGRTINTGETFESSDIGKLAFLVENSYINGHKIRSPFVRVKFVDNGSEKVALFASRMEVIESKNQ